MKVVYGLPTTLGATVKHGDRLRYSGVSSIDVTWTSRAWVLNLQFFR